MTRTDEKVNDLKYATRRLRAAQEDLREARARYNKAVTALVDNNMEG